MYKENDIVIMKKGHPCGENKWKIIRLGLDVKLECTKCNRLITIKRNKFNKSVLKKEV